jgi:hypothetical protein
MEELRLVFIIVNHGSGDDIVAEVAGHLQFCHIALGHGTADSDILDMLGLAGNDKDVLIAAATPEGFAAVKEILLTKFHFNHSGSGVAFTIPIHSVGGMVTLQLLSGKRI